MRTIYIWHALALFTKDNNGNYKKPTEGLSEPAYNVLKNHVANDGGCWVWICWSKSTDLAPTKKRKSYVIGAVFITRIVATSEFKKNCEPQRHKKEFQHSKDFGYQAIIPMHAYTRYQLPAPLPIHDVVNGENRVNLWKPLTTTDTLNILLNTR
jgi:hypothetical protein